MADKNNDRNSKPIVRPAAESKTASPTTPRAARTTAARPAPASTAKTPATKTAASAPSTATQRAAASRTGTATPRTAAPRTGASVQKPVETVKISTPAHTATPAKPSPAATTRATAARKTGAEETAATKRVDTPAAKSAPEKSAVKPAAVKPSENAKASARVAASQKTETPKTAEPKKHAAKSSGGASAATAGKNDKLRLIIITVVAVIVALSLVFGVAFGARACVNARKPGPTGNLSDVDVQVPTSGEFIKGSSVKPSSAYDSVSMGEEHLFEEPDNTSVSYNTANKTNTIVGYEGKVIGTVDRNIPTKVRDEGMSAYPKYGYTLSTAIGNSDAQKAARTALINESSYLTAKGTWNGGAGGYTWMDENGFLYSGSTAEPVKVLDKIGHHRRLYKHSASVGLYGGDVSDTEPGIIKKVTFRPRGYDGYGVTGVYAPAGELIKITLSEEDMNATGGVVVHIGQALYNGKANNIWTAKNQLQRMGVILNTMSVDKNTSVYDETTRTYTAYVGSFLGGPLYIRNEGATFSATISGGVAYQHFILGYTTEDEFEKNAASSAPYFDLEVWHYGALHSGPKRQVNGLTYRNLYKAAVYWDKVASVTTTNSLQGIVFIYDPFVAAGAAVAFPGQRSVNCPEGWMRSSLNYNGMVSSGSWGNMHEYHHNFQGYGVGNGGEVTNNGMTLVSYALFTKISANRGESNFGGQGLGGWNLYTSAPWALEETLKISRGQDPGNGKQGLALYAALLHNFGPDNYIQAKVKQQRTGAYGENYEGYLKAWQDVTHNNMTYFFKDVLKGIDDAKANEISAEHPEYPMFVPAASVYQTGRSYMFDGQKKYFTTMQPYVIPYGEDFTVDLRPYMHENGQYRYGSIVLPDGFTYTIKNVTQPQNGTITPASESGVYTYTPADGKAFSGQIIVTLEITNGKGTFAVDDIDLVLEFEQSHETNKMTLQRTTYTYSDANKYTDAVTAFENNYAGYATVNKTAHSNFTQNCNTDVWYRLTPETPDDPHVVPENGVVEISGKLYIEDAGKYRVYLRGRKNCAMYYSLNGTDYKLGATIKEGVSANFRPDDPNTYVDLEMPEHSWIYFKEVMIAEAIDGSRASFIGLGLRQWTAPMFTMVEKYYDKNGKEVAGPDAPGYDHTVTHYYDYQGNEVSEEEANSSEIIAPVINGNNDQPYVNAYNSTYEFPTSEGFTSEYYYERSYNYNYADNVLQNGNQTIVSSKYSPATNSSWGGYPFNQEKLIDGNKNTWIHTSGNVSESNPLEFVIDMGEVRAVNRMVLYSQNRGDLQVPKAFSLYGSMDGQDFFLVHEETDVKASATLTFNFEEKNFRYYKLDVTKSSGGFIILSEIEMWKVFEVPGGKSMTLDSDVFEYSGEWRGEQTYSTYGHVYVGKNGSEISFEFTGTRVGFVVPDSYKTNFEVYIDGKKVSSIGVKEDGSRYYMAYLCDALDAGTHTVTLKCTGEAAIDSVVVFP